METRHKIQEITARIHQLKNERDELMKQSITENEFQIGDKVRIFENYGQGEVDLGPGIISRMKVGSQNGDIYYEFSQITVQGTASVLGIPVQGKVRIEALQQ